MIVSHIKPKFLPGIFATLVCPSPPRMLFFPLHKTVQIQTTTILKTGEHHRSLTTKFVQTALSVQTQSLFWLDWRGHMKKRHASHPIGLVHILLSGVSSIWETMQSHSRRTIYPQFWDLYYYLLNLRYILACVEHLCVVSIAGQSAAFDRHWWSFNKMLNISGPRIDPCGTLLEIVCHCKCL